MFGTLPIVQLYCRNYSVFFNATEHLSYVLQQHLMETTQGQDRLLLEHMMAKEDDFGSRMIAMYGFCTTPLCKAAKRLMCAHLVRRVKDPLHLLAMWGNAPGRSHPYSGSFPAHAPFDEDLKLIRYIFHDLSLPTVDLAWFVRIELRTRFDSVLPHAIKLTFAFLQCTFEITSLNLLLCLMACAKLRLDAIKPGMASCAGETMSSPSRRRCVWRARGPRTT